MWSISWKLVQPCSYTSWSGFKGSSGLLPVSGTENFVLEQTQSFGQSFLRMTIATVTRTTRSSPSTAKMIIPRKDQFCELCTGARASSIWRSDVRGWRSESLVRDEFDRIAMMLERGVDDLGGTVTAPGPHSS